MKQLRWIFSLSLLLAAPLAGAAFPFAAGALVEDDLARPRDVAIAEIDGDELLDVVACSDTTGEVVYQHKVGTTYVTVTVSSDLHSPYTLATGDLDRDGDADIVVGQFSAVAGADPEDAEVLWLRNPGPGGGAWAAFEILELATRGVEKVAVGDLDGDGDLDVAVADFQSGPAGQVLWVANPGDPEAAWTSHGIRAFSHPYDLDLADLDEDGDLDVVVAEVSDGRVVLLRSDGTPADGGWVEEEIEDLLDDARSVAVGDVDRDGVLDVAVAAGGASDSVAWYEKSGASWTRHGVATSFGGADDVELVDLDQDGDLDLIAAAASDDELAWFDNFLGDGTYWLERGVATGVDGAGAIGAADLDLDGDLDLVAAAYWLDWIHWWKNATIHRRFRAPERLAIRSGLADPRELTIADLNGDGWLDLATALWGGGAVEACLAVVPDSNAWWTNTIVASGFAGSRAVTTADLDGDGALDVLAAAVNDNDVDWWHNDGAWEPDWTVHHLLGELAGAHRTAPADFDLDGDVDVAVAGLNADRVGLALNADGHGTEWDYYPDLFTVDGPFDLKSADIDRNGKPDLAVSGYYASSIRVMLNRFPVDWLNVAVATGATTPRGLDLCDLDRDGDLDLAVVLRDVDLIRWYENENGDGQTWSPHDVGSGSFVDGAGLRCADFDRDGDADVAAAGQDGDAVYVWLNGGTGTSWSRYMMDTLVDTPWAVDSGDLDRDGDLDLAVAAGGTTDSLLWYRNVGGQYGTLGYDEAPTHLHDGERRELLSFIVTHHGRALDSDLEVFVLFVDFSTPDGAALTSAQANALIETIEVFRDDDDMIFEPGVDPLVRAIGTLGLAANGRQDIPLLGDPDARVSPGESQRFWIAVTATAGASGQSPNQIVASFPAGELVAIDASYDFTLVDEPAATVSTDPVFFGDLLFADDFETGDCSRWDAWAGS